MIRPLLVAVVAAGPLVGPATAGEIRGTLHLAVGAAVSASAPNPYPGSARALPGGHDLNRSRVADAVVYVERIPASADSALARNATRPRLSQKDQSFVPHVLPVAVGTTVDFPNLDPIFHNVFSLSPVKRFDLGKYPRGQSRPVRFDRLGLVNVYCDIHSDMSAYVLVLPNHAFTQPDASGAFHLPPVPAGRYVVRVWSPDVPEMRREVEVPAEGAVVLDLAP